MGPSSGFILCVVHYMDALLVKSLVCGILANRALATAAQPFERLVSLGVTEPFGTPEAAFSRAAVAGARGGQPEPQPGGGVAWRQFDDLTQDLESFLILTLFC